MLKPDLYDPQFNLAYGGPPTTMAPSSMAYLIAPARVRHAKDKLWLALRIRTPGPG